MEPQNLEEQFHKRMLSLCQEAARVVNFPTILSRRIQKHGGVEAARRTVQDMTPTFEKLWEAKRLDLTVEAVVLDPQWAELFAPEDLAIARQRLVDVGYLQLRKR